MSAENTKTLTFVSLKLFLGGLSIVIMSCSSAICGVLSINSQIQVKIQADEERTPTHCLIINRIKVCLC